MRFCCAAIVLGAFAGASAVAADDLVGMQLYDRYCASCHGASGDGHGPASSALAGLLQVDVPDITHLAEANDGVFPMLEVIHVIDGRTGIRAHGGTMPVWGTVFSAEVDNLGIYGSAIETRGRVLSLALYLEGIQR
jgi:mono/diheme cytochrome c family protein